MAISSSTDVGADPRERGTSPASSLQGDPISPPGETAPKSRSWLWYLAIGETIACISALTPPAEPLKDLILVGGSLALVGAFIVAFSSRFAGRPAPWIILACGQVAFLVGNVILLIARVRGATLPFPSFADLFFLAAYPCFAVAMVLFLRDGKPLRDRGVLIDATIITIGAGSLIWVISVVPLVHLTGVTDVERAWSIAYPAMDLLLLAVGVWILIDRGTRTPSARMLIASFAGLLIGDIWYGRELVHGTFQPGGLIYAIWIASFISMGAAVLHPSARRPFPHRPRDQGVPGRAQILLLMLGALLVPATAAIHIVDDPGMDIDVVGLIALSGIVFLLVSMRVNGIFHDLDRARRLLRARAEATAALAGSDSVDQAVPKVLEALSRNLGWSFGEIWWLDRSDGRLHFGGSWTAPGARPLEPLPSRSSFSFASGEGLPGKVLATRGPVWVPELSSDASFVRKEAATEAGLRFGFGVPIQLDGEAIGVIALFGSESRRAPSEDVLDVASSVGSQTGAFVRRANDAQANRRLAAIVESSNDAVIGETLASVVTSWNLAAERMYGWTAEEMVGNSVSRLVPEDRVDELAQIFEILASGRGVKHLETLRLRKDGTQVAVSLTVSPVRDERGTIVGASSIARDISEQKIAEQVIRRSVDRLEGLVAIDRAILGARSTSELANDALRRLRRIASADRASLLEFDVEAGAATYLAVDPPGIEPRVGTVVPLDRFIPMMVIQEERVRSFPDLQAPDVRSDVGDSLVEQGLRSAASASLVTDEGVIGLVALSWREVGGSSLMDADVLRETADQLAIAIRQARLAEVASQHAIELEETIERLRQLDEQRQRLFSRLVDAQEEERGRIAGEIHDDPIQSMTAVLLRLGTLRLDHPELDGEGQLVDVMDTVGRAIEDLRGLMFDLRPYVLDRDGLVPALDLYLTTRVAPYVEATCELVDRLPSEPPEAIRVVLFRIAQEALTNIRKHAADGTRIDVVIEQRDHGYALTVSDDGVGFDRAGTPDSPEGHFGLTSMRERADGAGGWCRIESAEGRGTTVEAWVPEGRRT
jgi:PAS domain S-box-containing protein